MFKKSVFAFFFKKDTIELHRVHEFIYLFYFLFIFFSPRSSLKRVLSNSLHLQLYLINTELPLLLIWLQLYVTNTELPFPPLRVNLRI